MIETNQNQEVDENENQMEVDDSEVEDMGVEALFMSELDTESQEEVFSQEFSQVSLKDEYPSPAQKRLKLSTQKKVDHTKEPTGENTCPLCKVYIGGNKTNITRHIRNSCPNNTEIDSMEAERRKKKQMTRTAKKNTKKPNLYEEPVKPEEPEEMQAGSHSRLWTGGDCGCRGSKHSHDCLRLRGGAGHMRLPRHAPAPHLNPDPDALAPHLLQQIIPAIQALNHRFTNRQNRWIAHLGPPRLQPNVQNRLWFRAANSFQIPATFGEEQFQNLFYFSRQQAFQLRNTVTYPMLQARAAQAQGARGALSSMPHTLTPDSLTCLFLEKVRLNPADRTAAAELGVEHAVVQKWTKVLRDYYFNNDPFIQRNINLHDPNNLRALLQQAVDATAQDQRTSALYGPLAKPGTQLLVVMIDSRAVKIQKSQDPYLQKRSISTKINNNSVQKMTISTCEGLPLVTFPLMCSISPAGTDESNCEHLITIHENGVAGGLRAFMESPLTEPVTLVLLEDQGFRKFGFDHANRRSFTDYQDNLENITNGGFRYFTPCFPSDFYRDQNFDTVAQYPNLPGGSRHRCLTASTSSSCCTKTRWPVEALFGKEHQLKLLGSEVEIPQQFLSSCGIPNHESQSILYVWLEIGDSLLYHHGTRDGKCC